MSDILKAVAKELFPDVDGYVKYWPKQGGFLEAHHLRAIADELDRRNKAWDDEVNRMHLEMESRENDESWEPTR